MGSFGRTWEAPGAQSGALGAPFGQANFKSDFLVPFWWISTPGPGGVVPGRGPGLKPLKPHLRVQLRAPKKEGLDDFWTPGKPGWLACRPGWLMSWQACWLAGLAGLAGWLAGGWLPDI